MNVEVRKELENIRDARDLSELQVTLMNSTFLTIAGAIKYYVIYRTMPALKQFEVGLSILGLLEKLKVFKEEFKQLMCYTDSKLTATQVSSIFTVKLSKIGSNKRNKESEASLEDVLCFALACEKIPPLGFDNKPELEFLHNEKSYWPKANTCGLILYLPVSYETHQYEKFKRSMDYAILNSKQFGFA
ncbi:hypothetical protein ABEB36_014179 [Hypothenemus hampei]|uniref:HECT domain-containing protein n=1 Tax=Hypothenemus hampei TaxID=57062 RepID=A0ABD1E3I8_HYPHA